MSEDRQQEEQNSTVPPEVEADARAAGWSPQAEWRGDPEKWLPADRFLEETKIIVPALRKKNNELRRELSGQAERLRQLEETVKGATATIKLLEESRAEDVKEQVAAATRELKDSLAAALEAGDHARAAELTDKLTDLKAAQKTAQAKDDAQVAQGQADVKAAVPNADFQRWHSANSWFNGASREDKRLTRFTLMMAEELRAEGDTTIGPAFLDRAAQRAREELGLTGAPRDEGAGKVLGGSGGGNRSGGGGGAKGYESLPADAKAACDSQAKMVVGPNRKFKDLASWRKEYVRIYNEL